MESAKVLKYMIQGAIGELPKEDQEAVYSAADKIRGIVNAPGGHGLMALALVGAEAEDE